MPQEQDSDPMADNPAVPEREVYANVLHNVLTGRAEDEDSTVEVEDNTVTVDRDELIQGVSMVVQQTTYDYQQGRFDDGSR